MNNEQMLVSEMRSHLQGILQALDAYLKNCYEESTTHQPTTEDEKSSSKPEAAGSAIKWVSAEGPRGPYEKASIEDNKDSEEFQDLLEDLREHGDRLTLDGFFVWLFDKMDAPVIGRKRMKETET